MVVVVGDEVDVDVEVDADDVLVVELELDVVVGVLTDGTVTDGIVIWLRQYTCAWTNTFKALPYAFAPLAVSTAASAAFFTPPRST